MVRSPAKADLQMKKPRYLRGFLLGVILGRE
jgi:hypothetical protein